jgi:hypothetical protein
MRVSCADRPPPDSLSELVTTQRLPRNVDDQCFGEDNRPGKFSAIRL